MPAILQGGRPSCNKRGTTGPDNSLLQGDRMTYIGGQENLFSAAARENQFSIRKALPSLKSLLMVTWYVPGLTVSSVPRETKPHLSS